MKGSLTANDKLKRQLFGKDWNKIGSQKHYQNARPRATPNQFSQSRNHVAPKAKPDARQSLGVRGGDNSDDEGGRSSLGKSKKRKVVEVPQSIGGRRHNDQQSTVEAPEEGSKKAEVSPEVSQKQRGGSYLDELLSERSKKKKKNKNKRNKDVT